MPRTGKGNSHNPQPLRRGADPPTRFSSRSFKYDFPGSFHGARDCYRHGPRLQSNGDFAILKLRLIEGSQLTLQLPGTFPRENTLL